MKRLDELDVNFKIETKIDKENIKFYDVRQEPFKIHGLIYEDGKFRRMPKEIAEKVSDGVKTLHAHTSGGRVRFITDSPYVAISVKICAMGRMSHFALTGSAGLDLYVKENGKDRYFGTFIPPYYEDGGFEGIVEFRVDRMSEPTWEKREIMIDFPLYSEVSELYVGLDGNAQIGEPTPYKNGKAVYYGHSITQGGCASRPGNAYPAILSRKFDLDFVNLGFSGNARGERAIAEYIKGLDMDIFIYDYDYNSPDKDHLLSTHEPMFKMIREAHPNIPVIMLSSTQRLPNGDWQHDERRDVVKRTYENARNSGDENVYFIDGGLIFGEYDDGSTVEGVHPNDVGFREIAEAVSKVMEKIIKV